MWHKLNCFTAVTVCLSVALDPWETACFAHAATELIASHLSQIIIYAIQQRFLLLEPHTATALSALYSIGFYPFIKRYEQHVLRTLTLKNSAFCPQKVHKCIIWISKQAAIMSLTALTSWSLLRGARYFLGREGEVSNIIRLCHKHLGLHRALFGRSRSRISARSLAGFYDFSLSLRVNSRITPTVRPG